MLSYVIIAMLVTLILFIVRSPRVRWAYRQLCLLRRSMRKEFHTLETDHMQLIFPEKHAKKVTLEG